MSINTNTDINNPTISVNPNVVSPSQPSFLIQPSQQPAKPILTSVQQPITNPSNFPTVTTGDRVSFAPINEPSTQINTQVNTNLNTQVQPAQTAPIIGATAVPVAVGTSANVAAHNSLPPAQYTRSSSNEVETHADQNKGCSAKKAFLILIGLIGIVGVVIGILFGMGVIGRNKTADMSGTTPNNDTQTSNNTAINQNNTTTSNQSAQIIPNNDTSTSTSTSTSTASAVFPSMNPSDQVTYSDSSSTLTSPSTSPSSSSTSASTSASTSTSTTIGTTSPTPTDQFGVFTPVEVIPVINAHLTRVSLPNDNLF